MKRTAIDNFFKPLDMGSFEPGDIVTLKSGHRGIVNELGESGEFTILSGKHCLSCYYPGDIARVDHCRKKRVRIYQIDIESEFAFMNYDWLRSKGRSSPPAYQYNIVFDGQLETDSLEDVFRIFNLEHPEGYTGRSLSVSDIVELYDERDRRFYFCDAIGFKKIPFKPVNFNYVLFAFSERESFDPQVFSSYDKAYLQMRRELKAQLGGFDVQDSGNYYGIDNVSAWSNYRGNHDWCIYRISEDSKGRKAITSIPQNKLTIWTYFKTPFAFGSQGRLTGCEVYVVEKLDLGHGYFGYRVPMPNGGDVICEGLSGAIVGNSLDMVREDIRSGDNGMMRRQVEEACQKRKQVEIIDPEEFWDVYMKSVERKQAKGT